MKLIPIDLTEFYRGKPDDALCRTVAGLLLHPPTGIEWEPVIWRPLLRSFARIEPPKATTLLAGAAFGKARLIRGGSLSASALRGGLFLATPPDAARAHYLHVHPGIPTVAMCLELEDWEAERRFQRRPSREAVEAARALGSTGLVIVPTEWMRDLLTHAWEVLKCETTKILVLPCPPVVDGDRAEPVAADGMPLILCASRMERQGELPALLAACDLLWSRRYEFELHLIGGSAPDAEPLLDMVQASVARGRLLRRSPDAPPPVREELWRRAWFSVHVNPHEGSGTAIRESLWHYRPVLCSKDGAGEELAGDGGCHLLEISDPQILADSILDNIQNPAPLYQETIERGMPGWKEFSARLGKVAIFAG